MPYFSHPGLRTLLLPAVIAVLLAAQNSQAQSFSEAGTPVSPAQREDNEFATPIEDCLRGQTADAKGRSSSATSNSSVIAQAGVDIFTARYSAKAAWSGWINAETVQADGSITAAAGWQGKSTADHLDALSDQQVLNERLILTWSDRLQRGVLNRPGF
ncbi:hypothetical protein [Delftia acidovorans]|uniref:hypothetical protein n=1 Tax=Delftia acidovorans TaxID=80866 RepID=UPI0022AB90E8|nr:hypothetical protein [Delftia acidovorans]WAT87132.1 hypothetical protein O1V13_07735 [Delftia acidovorans]